MLYWPGFILDEIYYLLANVLDLVLHFLWNLPPWVTD